MLRVTEFVRSLLEGRRPKQLEGVVLIWNLTQKCNLSCKHCYSSSGPEKKKELTKEEALSLIPSLKKAGVRFAILSGGEPLLRDDVFLIAEELRSKGIRTYLSTNGLLVNRSNIGDIASCFDYVGVSVDGTPKIHEAFRGGSFERAVKALELCLSENIRTGVRFTLTEKTLPGLFFVLKLAKTLGVPKAYVSHLVYAGRGLSLAPLRKKEYRSLAELLIKKAVDWAEAGVETEIVTGNNEADAVLLLEEFSRRYPEKREELLKLLKVWGGNQSGVRIVNVDHEGNVKPDPFFPFSVGNVKERPFEEIWNSNGLFSFLRERPRRLKGKCSGCPYLEICNGNSRARALATFGDVRAEDPACYL